MSKSKLIGALVCTTCVIVAVGAAAASATLWLVAGKSLSSATKVTVHIKFILRYTDGTEIECSALFIGTVGPGAQDLRTEVEGLDGEKDLLSHCTDISGGFCDFFSFEVHAVNLPWKTLLLLLSDGTTWNMISADGKGNPGWLVLCALGTNVECTTETEIEKFEGNGTNGAKFAFKGKESGEAECSNGETGVIESKGAGEVLGATVS